MVAAHDQEMSEDCLETIREMKGNGVLQWTQELFDVINELESDRRITGRILYRLQSATIAIIRLHHLASAIGLPRIEAILSETVITPAEGMPQLDIDTPYSPFDSNEI